MDKVCSKCLNLKPKTSFNKRKISKDGLQPKCKECHRKETNKYSLINKDLLQAQSKEWYRKNKIKVLQGMKVYYQQNSTHIKERVKLYNKVKGNQDRNFRYHNDIQYKLSCVLRSRLRDSIKGLNKGGSAVDDLGCSILKLKIHLQLQFHRKPSDSRLNMDWNHWSNEGWHIDHIRPLCSFDLTDPEQLKVACNYKNLRPLWSTENLRRGYVKANSKRSHTLLS